MRPSKDEYYLDIALAVASRGTCLRRNYGCVMVKDDEIVSTGYSGPPRGEPHCTECPRNAAGTPSGSDYSDCRSVHSEQNAMIHASRKEMLGATAYIAGIDAVSGEELDGVRACQWCSRMMKNAGIERVVCR